MGAVNSTTQIFEILESTLESINNVLDVAVKNKIDGKKIENAKNIIENCAGILTIITSNESVYATLNQIKITKKAKKNIIDANDILLEVLKFGEKTQKYKFDTKLILKSLDTINEILSKFSEILENISKINVAKIAIALLSIPLLVLAIISFFGLANILGIIAIPLIPIMLVSMIGLSFLRLEFQLLKGIFDTISEINIISAYFHIKMIDDAVKIMDKLVNRIFKFITKFNFKKVTLGILSLAGIGFALKTMMNSLAEIEINLLISFKIKRCIKVIGKLEKLMKRVSKIRISKTSFKKIIMLSVVMLATETAIKAGLTAAIVSIPFTLLYPALLLGVGGLILFTKLIKFVKVSKSTFKSVIRLAAVTNALILVFTGIILTSLVASAIDPASLLHAGLALLGVMMLMYILNVFKKVISNSFKTIRMLTLSCMALVIAAGAIFLVGAIGLTIPISGVLLMMLIIAGLSFLFSQIGDDKIWKNILKGAGVLTLMGLSLIIFSYGFSMLLLASRIVSIDDALRMAAVIGALALAFAAVGAFAGIIALGAAAIAAIGAALLILVIPFNMFVGTILTLKQTKVTEEDIKMPIQMMGNLINAINKVFGLDALVTIPLAAAKVMALIPVALAISTMAETLQEISSLNMPIEWDDKGKPTKFVKMEPKNFKDAAINACNIAKIMANVFGEKPVELTILGEKITLNPITQKELEAITFSSRIKMRNLSKITESISDMAETLRNIASLNMPIEFNNTGKPTKFKAMESKDFIEAATNAHSIAKLLANLFGEEPITLTVKGAQVQLNPITKQELEGITWRNRIKMNNLAKITDSIGEMAYVIQQIASLNMPCEWNKEGKAINFRKMEPKDFTEATQNVAIIATTLISAITNPALATKIEDMSRRSIKKVAEILNAIGSLNGLVNAIQQMVQMNVPTAFDKKGQPIAFKTITQQERATAIENIKLLMTEFLSAIADPKLSEKLEEMDEDAAENFQRVMSTCTSASTLVDTIKKAASFDKKTIAEGIINIKEAILRYTGVINDLFVDKWDWARKTEKVFGFSVSIPYYTVVDKSEIDAGKIDGALRKMESIGRTITPIKSLIDSITEVSSSDAAAKARAGVDAIKGIVINYAQIFTGDENGKGGINISETGKKKFAAFQEIVKYQDYFAKIQTKDLAANTSQFVKLVDKANSIDTTKITTVRDMFKQMAEFSKSINGNFDKLADVISEKLIEALEKLAEIFDKANNVNNKNNNNTMGQTGAQTQTEKSNESINSIKNIEGILDEISSLVSAIKRNTSKDSFFDY